MAIKQTDQASVVFGFTISGFGEKREKALVVFFLVESILDFA